jgi:hypothetical protein
MFRLANSRRHWFSMASLASSNTSRPKVFSNHEVTEPATPGSYTRSLGAGEAQHS